MTARERPGEERVVAELHESIRAVLVKVAEGWGRYPGEIAENMEVFKATFAGITPDSSNEEIRAAAEVAGARFSPSDPENARNLTDDLEAAVLLGTL